MSIDPNQPIDEGRYALALSQQRKARGLNLSLPIHFDPDLHPRDLKGKFKNILGGLAAGQSVELPDGTRVEAHRVAARTGGGKHNVARKAKIDPKAKPRNERIEYTVHPVTGSSRGARSPEEAAHDALKQSAKSKHPRSIGGGSSYTNLDNAITIHHQKIAQNKSMDADRVKHGQAPIHEPTRLGDKAAVVAAAEGGKPPGGGKLNEADIKGTTYRVGDVLRNKDTGTRYKVTAIERDSSDGELGAHVEEVGGKDWAVLWEHTNDAASKFEHEGGAGKKPPGGKPPVAQDPGAEPDIAKAVQDNLPDGWEYNGGDAMGHEILDPDGYAYSIMQRHDAPGWQVEQLDMEGGPLQEWLGDTPEAALKALADNPPDFNAEDNPHNHGTPKKVGDDQVHDVGADVNKAADLLSQGKKVHLDQPRTASVLLSELAKRVQAAKDQGDSAPNFDLCKVTVKNTNLFCAESKGIPRVKMPQVKGVPTPGSRADSMPKNAKGEVDLSGEFRKSLEVRGVHIEDTTEKASFLRASQIELNGGKVAGMTQAMEAGKIPDEHIFVSHDNYIVDGHHRWAAKVGLDLHDNKLGDINMPVSRIDMDIIELLDESNKFASDWGIPQAGVEAQVPGDKASGGPDDKATFGAVTNAVSRLADAQPEDFTAAADEIRDIHRAVVDPQNAVDNGLEYEAEAVLQEIADATQYSKHPDDKPLHEWATSQMDKLNQAQDNQTPGGAGGKRFSSDGKNGIESADVAKHLDSMKTGDSFKIQDPEGGDDWTVTKNGESDWTVDDGSGRPFQAGSRDEALEHLGLDPQLAQEQGAGEHKLVTGGDPDLSRYDSVPDSAKDASTYEAGSVADLLWGDYEYGKREGFWQDPQEYLDLQSQNDGESPFSAQPDYTGSTEFTFPRGGQAGIQINGETWKDTDVEKYLADRAATDTDPRVNPDAQAADAAHAAVHGTVPSSIQTHNKDGFFRSQAIDELDAGTPGEARSREYGAHKGAVLDAIGAQIDAQPDNADDLDYLYEAVSQDGELDQGEQDLLVHALQNHLRDLESTNPQVEQLDTVINMLTRGKKGQKGTQ